MPKGTQEKGKARKQASKATAEAKKEERIVVRTAPNGRGEVSIPSDRAEAGEFARTFVLEGDRTPLPGTRSKYAGTDFYLPARFAPHAEHTEGDAPARNPRQGSEFGNHGATTLRALRDVAFAIGGAGYVGPIPFEHFSAYLAQDPYPGLRVPGKTGTVASTYRTQGIGRHIDASVRTYRQIGCVRAGEPNPLA